MKAIVDVARRGSIFNRVKEQLAQPGDCDYHLSFESAKTLFSELTPARLDLLEVLKRTGPCSIYALAKTAQRNYSNVHTDVAKLLELGLIARTEDDSVIVPFSAVEIHMTLAEAA
jgi:predicted transcriptional regulator